MASTSAFPPGFLWMQVNFETPERTPKDSARYHADVVRRHGADL